MIDRDAKPIDHRTPYKPVEIGRRSTPEEQEARKMIAAGYVLSNGQWVKQ